jgi:hypothetical protein
MDRAICNRDIILTSYYFNLSYFFNKISDFHERLIFDSRGIPLYNYDPPLGPRHNPVTVALYGLECYQKKNYDDFFKIVEWLIKESHNFKDSIIWLIEFPIPFKEKKSGWMSGLAQALGISVMVRAYWKKKEYKYLNYALKAFRGLMIPVKDGVRCI